MGDENTFAGVGNHLFLQAGRRRNKQREVPDATFAEYLKEYVADLKEADRQGFIPQWAEKLFMEDYEIKLYR